jgi:tRNA(fMet)-specific endonuclease VapC
MFMLDSDICIYAINHRHGVRERLLGTSRASVFLSSIVIAELAAGCEKSVQRERNLRALQDFKTTMTVVAFEDDDTACYALARAQLERVGTPIGATDLFIGAHALARGMTLITNNVREFSRIPELRLDNWASHTSTSG